MALLMVYDKGLGDESVLKESAPNLRVMWPSFL